MPSMGMAGLSRREDATVSIEAMWYASYDEDGRPPRCNRLTRMPWAQQMGVAFDLALDLPAGRAGTRGGRISTTGETYWWWPDRPHRKYGDWWLLPLRTVRLMGRATEYAADVAQERPSETLNRHDHVRVVLRRLQRRAHKAARAMIGREAPAFVPRTPKLRKLSDSLRILPDSAELLCAMTRRMDLAA